jgi:general secretion pathway protein C
MFVRVCAFVIWALVAGTVVFWGLRLLVRSPDAPAHAVPVGAAVAVRGDLTRLLGAAPVATAAAAAANPEASSRFRLLGVMAPKAGPKADASGQGVALIAVDGKPAKAFAVGARLDNDLVLQAVSLRTASIGPPEGGVVSVKLEIPPLPPPATGTLPSGGATPSVAAPLALPVPPPPPVPAQAIPSVVPPVMVAPPQPPQPPQPAAASPPLPVPNASAPRRDFGAANR